MLVAAFTPAKGGGYNFQGKKWGVFGRRQLRTQEQFRRESIKISQGSLLRRGESKSFPAGDEDAGGTIEVEDEV